MIYQHIGFDSPVVIERDCVLFAHSVVLPVCVLARDPS
jgi:hypothetical protein